MKYIYVLSYQNAFLKFTGKCHSKSTVLHSCPNYRITMYKTQWDMYYWEYITQGQIHFCVCFIFSTPGAVSNVECIQQYIDWVYINVM